MDLVKGQRNVLDGEFNAHSTGSFWDMWMNDLPGSFSKSKFRNDFEQRWSLAWPNIISRLKRENFMFWKADLNFLYDNYAIDFDQRKGGFFFDHEQHKRLVRRNLAREGKNYGLSAPIE